ncbi:MAG: Asp/Glu racemase [Sulfitobacter sp.]
MKLPYTLATEHPTQLALVVLQSDETIEHDMRRLLPSTADVLVTRVPSAAVLTTDSIAAMENKLTDAAALLPRGTRMAAVGYGCTSASAQIGPSRVAEQIQKGVEVSQVTEPVSALIAACRALQVTNLGFISPYSPNISDKLRQVLAEAAIETPHFGSFDEPKEQNVVRITTSSLVDAAKTIGAGQQVDAVFLSCTNLRTLDVISQIEDVVQKPVLSSNQVLAWHMMQLANVTPPPNLPGRLWQS